MKRFIQSMKNSGCRRIKNVLLLIILFTFGATTFNASATCVRKNFQDSGGDTLGAPMNLGNINLTSNDLQPVGTILATSFFTLFPSKGGIEPDTVLFECDLADANNIYQVFATNGDSNVGGFTNFGDNYFQTFFRYTALKLVEADSGLEFTRIWQKTPITHYATVGDKIQIRGQDFSAIRAELIKTDQYDPTPGFASWGCPGPAAADYTGPYNCQQPNGYVAFSGPGVELTEIGLDSNTNFPGWGLVRYYAFGMNIGPSTVTNNNTCGVVSTTPVVTFAKISPAELVAGGNRSANFNVEIRCQDGVDSGVSHGQTSIAIQTSMPAYIAAQKINLVNGAGGVSYLLSDGYGTDTSVATGVGIRLEDSAGMQRYFTGWAPCVSDCASAENSGWYPVLSNATSNGTNGGYTTYESTYSAILEALPGQTPKAGKVDAMAYVLVKVQ
nr:fimbrial protein [uncultured Enterobacter sp.]